MFQTTLDDMLVQVRARLEQDDLASAVALIESLRSPDQADLFAELSDSRADRAAAAIRSRRFGRYPGRARR